MNTNHDINKSFKLGYLDESKYDKIEKIVFSNGGL